MAQIGNKLNSFLNYQYAKHCQGKWWKRFTSKMRRKQSKKEVQEVYKIREL